MAPEGTRRRTRGGFYATITAAVKDVVEHGFDSEARVRFWMEEIRKAAVAEMVPADQLSEVLDATLRAIYRKLVDRGLIARYHPGIHRFTIERIRPQLRSELDRRILASANLIKLNREAAIQKTLQRFAGWSTSIPVGGTDAANKTKTVMEVRKALKSLPFEERRVLIDQGHKLTSSLNDILAKDGGALACTWHSHWRQRGYDYREDHKERDGLFYAVRDNWAITQGLMKRGPNGYSDEITTPGEEVFCRCYYSYVYALRDLPAEMLTARGRAALNNMRVA